MSRFFMVHCVESQGQCWSHGEIVYIENIEKRMVFSNENVRYVSNSGAVV